MSAPVDLANLRSMTDGDVEMEKALFDEFFSAFEAGMANMQKHVNSNEEWRREAHALKGMALNLGAQALGELCKKGQDHPDADRAQKSALLQSMQAEYASVRQFLTTL